MMPVFIVGCGDIGQRVAALWRARGAEVHGLARSEEAGKRLAAKGIAVVAGDLEQPASLNDLPTAGRIVYYFAPPPVTGDSDPLMKNFLQVIADSALPKTIVLISTTAVYGDCHGEWIDETRPVNPQTARGRRRLDAEQQLRKWCEARQVGFVILRVGGIYGPGRLPVARLRQGLPILNLEQSPYTNRIHQDDLARICVAAAERGTSGAIYNVSDGQPGTMSQYFIDVAAALQLPAPRQVDMAEAKQVMSAGMLSYLQESRRLDNEKMLDDLRIELQYPNLAAGLAGLKKAAE